MLSFFLKVSILKWFSVITEVKHTPAYQLNISGASSVLWVSCKLYWIFKYNSLSSDCCYLWAKFYPDSQTSAYLTNPSEHHLCLFPWYTMESGIYNYCDSKLAYLILEHLMFFFFLVSIKVSSLTYKPNFGIYLPKFHNVRCPECKWHSILKSCFGNMFIFFKINLKWNLRVLLNKCIFCCLMR